MKNLLGNTSELGKLGSFPDSRMQNKSDTLGQEELCMDSSAQSGFLPSFTERLH